MEDGAEQVEEGRHGTAPVEAMGACGTARPLQDLMGYMKIDLTVAAGSPPPPPPRREERKEAAFSMAMAWSCLGGVEDGVSSTRGVYWLAVLRQMTRELMKPTHAWLPDSCRMMVWAWRHFTICFARLL